MINHSKIDLFFTAVPKSSWLPSEELWFPSISALVKDFCTQTRIQQLSSCTSQHPLKHAQSASTTQVPVFECRRGVGTGSHSQGKLHLVVMHYPFRYYWIQDVIIFFLFLLVVLLVFGTRVVLTS